jgi:hypothetical protein
MAEKPILAPNRYDDRTIDLLNKLKENDVDISGIGSIDRSVNGGLQSIDKSLINGKIDQALKNGDITSDTARSLKSDVSMCGNPHDSSLADDISGSSLGDDVSRL